MYLSESSPPGILLPGATRAPDAIGGSNRDFSISRGRPALLDVERCVARCRALGWALGLIRRTGESLLWPGESWLRRGAEKDWLAWIRGARYLGGPTEVAQQG